MFTLLLGAIAAILACLLVAAGVWLAYENRALLRNVFREIEALVAGGCAVGLVLLGVYLGTVAVVLYGYAGSAFAAGGPG